MKGSKLCGIYCIRHDDRFYIGQSIDIKTRWARHRRNLINQVGNPKIQNSWNKYGADQFSFEVIEICQVELLTEREQYWIDTLDSLNTGFNCGPAGSSTNTGGHMTDEAKQHLSNLYKGIPRTPEVTAKIAAGVKAQANTPEGKLMRSINRTGHTHSEESKKKMADASRGVVMSEETKNKLSLSLKGRPKSQETKERMMQSRLKRAAEKASAKAEQQTNQSYPEVGEK